MSQITGLIDGSNVNHDYQITALANALINHGIISGLLVTTNSVTAGSAFIKCTRTNGQEITVHYTNTAAVTIDTSGTKKVWIGVDQSDIDDGSTNALDGTGIATIRTGASYPAENYIPLASIASGVITYEGKTISLKGNTGKRTGLPPNSVMITPPAILPIENANFSSGSGSILGSLVNGWIADGGGTAEFTGGRLKVATTGAGQYVNARSNGYVVQPGVEYDLSYKLQTNYTSGDSTGVQLYIYDEDGGLLYNPTPIKTTTGNTTYTSRFTTLSTSSKIDLLFLLVGNAGAGNLVMDAYIDDIVITPTQQESALPGYPNKVLGWDANGNLVAVTPVVDIPGLTERTSLAVTDMIVVYDGISNKKASITNTKKIIAPLQTFGSSTSTSSGSSNAWTYGTSVFCERGNISMSLSVSTTGTPGGSSDPVAKWQVSRNNSTWTDMDSVTCAFGPASNSLNKVYGFIDGGFYVRSATLANPSFCDASATITIAN